jgi:uncharacterized protein
MRTAHTLDIELPTRGPAWDKRTVSPHGVLTVTDCVISDSQVNSYVGREIPGCEALGLDPQKIYQLYRCPKALKAAVAKFNGIPLLIDHASVTPADPKPQMIAGAVSDCRWDNGRVLGTVSLWTDTAIQGVESNLRRDLSAGYNYKPVLGAGTTPDGERFDLRMTDIEPQHVALVETGRVSGAMVGDALPFHVAMENMVPGFTRLK